MSLFIVPKPRDITIDEFDASCAEPINEIIPGLFLGNEFGAGRQYSRNDSLEEKERALKERGITHILCATLPSKAYFEGKFIYEYIPIRDESSEKLSFYLSKAYDFIESGREEGGVFVHCAAGSSRSASLVIGYMMKKFSLSYENALHYVQSKRPCVKPNPGFEVELRCLEEPEF
jgi:hypothetical protein